MVKKTISRKKSTVSGVGSGHNQATRTQITTESEDRWVCGFDQDNSCMALVRTGVNGHKLRIMDMHTGQQRAGEYTANSGDRILSVNWGTSNSGVIALGLQSGQIQVYSPARNSVTITCQSSSTESSAIVDAQWSGDELFSLDSKGTVVQWDCTNGQAKKTLKTGLQGTEARRLLVSNDGSKVVVASHRIEMWEISKTSAPLCSWAGHTQSVHTLLWANESETQVVSAAELDRHLYVWDISSQSPSAMLALDCDVRCMDVSPVDGSVLAVGDDGVLYGWRQVAGSKTSGALQSDCRVRVVSSQDHSQQMAIHWGRFVQSGKVMLVRGSALKPLFETVGLTEDSGRFVENLELARDPQDNLLISNPRTQAERQLAAQHQGYSETNATVTDATTEAIRKSHKASVATPPTLAERMKQLSMGMEQQEGKKEGERLPAGTLIRVLVQALHTDDHPMLDSVLENNARTKVVKDTVAGLPSGYVLPFMQQLFAKFHASPNRAPRLLPWIRNTLALHSGFLTSIPSLVPQLSGFYQAIEARLDCHQKLLKLNGRLELANMQMKARAEAMEDTQVVKQQVAMKPVNVYREEDDEESVGKRSETHTPAWQAEESTDEEEEEGEEESTDDEDQWSDSEEEEVAVQNGVSDEEMESASGDSDSSDEDSGSDL